ncbi:helix-turn-helix domain-containing protein [Haladaptatus sp. DFWS20]|uniref:helix-turn-helix domain-containing protein n=1 Tax=Haladaptatus sp. DFWS20 TaxID=3403467 RepID=UPI003EC0FCA3
MKSGNGGWVVRVQLLSREPLIELRKRCLESDLTFKVRQLYDADPNAEIAETRLTGHQRNTVLTAYQSGYYNIPRGISQGELAEKTRCLYIGNFTTTPACDRSVNRQHVRR